MRGSVREKAQMRGSLSEETEMRGEKTEMRRPMREKTEMRGGETEVWRSLPEKTEMCRSETEMWGETEMRRFKTEMWRISTEVRRSGSEVSRTGEQMHVGPAHWYGFFTYFLNTVIFWEFWGFLLLFSFADAPTVELSCIIDPEKAKRAEQYFGQCYQNKEYYSFQKYSFYDMLDKMEDQRLPQPSAKKSQKNNKNKDDCS